ncbi:MAG: flagellar motor switch protein FliN [Polyangiaceae bacterium]
MTNPNTAPSTVTREPTTEGAPSPADDESRVGSLDLLKNVEVEITLEIGRRRLRIADVLKLSTGQTLELSKAAGEPLDIFINGRLLGRGEAIVMGDRYGVRITELVAPHSRDDA